MAIKVENYKLASGVNLKEVYIIVTDVSYSTKGSIFSFSASVCTGSDIDSEENVIIEQGTISAQFINFDYGNQNLIEVAEGLIEDKIDLVRGKTPEECVEHNVELPGDASWLDMWDYRFSKYISGEPVEDDDYSEAGRILLGVE